MREAIGVDLYNQCVTGGCYAMETFHCIVEKELAAPLKARDYKDPLIVVYEADNDLSESNGAADGKRIQQTRHSGSNE